MFIFNSHLSIKPLAVFNIRQTIQISDEWLLGREWKVRNVAPISWLGPAFLREPLHINIHKLLQRIIDRVINALIWYEHPLMRIKVIHCNRNELKQR